MLPSFVGSIWRNIPGAIRRRLVRLGQTRFTVTAGALIFDEAGRILLLEHVFRPDSGWGIPGGFLGRHEQPEEGIRRELREEIGIEVEDVSLLFVRTLKRPGHVGDYFTSRRQRSPHTR